MISWRAVGDALIFPRPSPAPEQLEEVGGREGERGRERYRERERERDTERKRGSDRERDTERERERGREKERGGEREGESRGLRRYVPPMLRNVLWC